MTHNGEKIVPKVGVEPTWAKSPLRPERSASACSATSARAVFYRESILCQPLLHEIVLVVI